MPNRAPRSWGYAVWGVAALVGLLGLAPITTITSAEEAAASAFDFDEPKVSFDSRFPGARLNDCVQVGPAEYRVTILPENTPINNSAWYAFQVTSDAARTITVRLSYQGGSHRYHPKISHDGLRWAPLDPQKYSRPEKGHEATLRLDVGPQPLWVAAQELITSRELNLWADKMARLPFVEKSLLGHSVLGQPIYKLQTTGAENLGCVFLIGRQHPPEVTGSLALMKFVETLFGASDLARRFRGRFNVIVVPLVNPDGVDAGHWRHNFGGVDLNRDWDRFDQPETRAVRDEILQFKSTSGPRLFLFLDFHSTHRDVFYTQPDHKKTNPEGFSRKWLDALQQRFPDYRVRRIGSHGRAMKTSKRWGYQVLGVPSITYEIGDHTDRPLIDRITQGAAEEMMRLLLIEAGAANNEAAFRNCFPHRTVVEKGDWLRASTPFENTKCRETPSGSPGW